jgi:hypothetical protein
MHRYLRAASAGGVLLLLAACSTFVDQRGNLPVVVIMALVMNGV